MKALSKLSKKVRTTFSVIRNIRHSFHYKSKRGENPPIFIVGCGHSGTSILLAILGSHSKIYAVPQETYLAYSLETRSAALKENARRKIRGFDRSAIAEKKMRWAEKTPSHIYSIKELFELCPGCKIILIIRDGRDVACSIQDRTSSLEEGINRWVKDNRAGQAFWNHPQVYTLNYEELIENFKPTITDVLGFLGENFEETMLHHHETPKLFYAKQIEKPPNAFGENHVMYRNWQINQPLFDGRGKWKRLSEDEKRLIKTTAGDMLIEYGYTEDMEW
jgi:hypothetical protein